MPGGHPLSAAQVLRHCATTWWQDHHQRGGKEHEAGLGFGSGGPARHGATGGKSKAAFCRTRTLVGCSPTTQLHGLKVGALRLPACNPLPPPPLLNFMDNFVARLVHRPMCMKVARHVYIGSTPCPAPLGPRQHSDHVLFIPSDPLSQARCMRQLSMQRQMRPLPHPTPSEASCTPSPPPSP